MRSQTVQKLLQVLFVLAAMATLNTSSLAGSCENHATSATTRNEADIVDVAVAAGGFDTLVAAVKAAGLVEALKGEGPLTVFAPTDEAFAKLPEATLSSLLQPENKDQLVAILTYHVVAGRVDSKTALKLGRAQTLQSGEVKISVKDGRPKVNDANLVVLDLEASNGIIHVIDTVLMPPPVNDQASTMRDVIELAINRGAPLYNDGQPMACAAIYEVAAQALLAMDGLDPNSERTLSRALRRADRTHDAKDRAWVMRDALDRVYGSIDEMELSAR